MILKPFVFLLQGVSVFMQKGLICLNKPLKKIQKIVIGSMGILFFIILLIFVLNYFYGEAMKKFEGIIAFVIILPFLLMIVLGIAFFSKKFNQVQNHSVNANLDILKEILGDAIQYLPNGKIPFHLIGEDPSIAANHANSIICNHFLTGKYNGVEFISTNIETTNSRGYGEVDYSIFDGFYILLNVNVPYNQPVYFCSDNFWIEEKFNEPLQFSVNHTKIYEMKNGDDFRHFKILAANEQIYNYFNQSDYKELFNNLFKKQQYPISIFVFSNGTVGMAIRKYKAFNFSEFNIFSIGEKELEMHELREKISKDAQEIKGFLETLLRFTNYFRE